MPGRILLDTGPWVALLCRDDARHSWAVQQFGLIPGPLLTCEAVVAETAHLMARAGHDPAKALALIARGVVQIDFSLAAEMTAVQALFERYDNVPASLADACLVRMSELHDRSRVLTLDSDFRIYRKHGRKVIPLIAPDGT